MSRIRLSLGCLLIGLMALAASRCTAQTAPKTSQLDPKTTRKIEILVRAKLSVPSDYQITFGQPTPSTMAGFDTVPVTFMLPGHPEHAQTLPFLLAKDGSGLGRFSLWDMSKIPTDIAPSAGRPMRGNPAARVVIVNYDDLECPFCAKMHANLFPDTLDHYNGLVKIVYRDLPLEELHPWAMHAAVNANCLAAQNDSAYWSYVDYLHTHGEDVSGPDHDIAKATAMLDKLAKQQGDRSKLDAAALNACVAKQDETAVRAEVKQASTLGLEQTPVLFVNGEMLTGALPIETVWAVIDRALLSEGIKPPATK